mgnify:CR=1 FL=1
MFTPELDLRAIQIFLAVLKTRLEIPAPLKTYSDCRLLGLTSLTAPEVRTKSFVIVS